MATGNIENWAGTIADLGPIYPFVGSEWLLWIIGMAFWIIWHILQSRIESRQYDDEVSRFGSKDKLRSLITKEDPENP